MSTKVKSLDELAGQDVEVTIQHVLDIAEELTGEDFMMEDLSRGWMRASAMLVAYGVKRPVAEEMLRIARRNITTYLAMDKLDELRIKAEKSLTVKMQKDEMRYFVRVLR